MIQKDEQKKRGTIFSSLLSLCSTPTTTGWEMRRQLPDVLLRHTMCEEKLGYDRDAWLFEHSGA